MAFDKTRKVVKNGTSIKPVVDVSKMMATDKFRETFGKNTIDLNSKGILTLRGSTSDTVAKKFTPFANMKTITKQVGKDTVKTSVNMEMVNVLNNLGMFGLHKNTPLAHTAKHGFTFNYQQQQEVRTSTVDAAVQAMTKINTLKTNKTGALYVFDLETFGGKTDDNRWFPVGITEFAMQKHNFATGERTATNILMTNKEMVDELDKYLKRYNKLMKEGGIDKVKQHDDVYVFAKRMSLYDPERGAKFALVDNVWQATNLISSEDTQAGNADAVARAVNQFKKMSKATGTDPVTGLSYDVKALISASGEMSRAVSNDTGVIGGHNILHFDRGVLDKDIRKIYNKQLSIMQNPNATTEAKKQASSAINYMNASFGGRIGLNFKEGNILDTLPAFKAGRDEGGFRSPNLQLGTLGEIYYPTLAASGTAHLGIHDTAMNISMILDPSEVLEGKSLMQYMMDNYLNEYNAANPVMTINDKQLFKVTNGLIPALSSGKGYMNYRQYHSTGDIYTSGNFKISGGKITYDNYAGNTGFDKGGFYSITARDVIDINSKELSAEAKEQIKQLQAAYPEMNTDKVYHMAFTSHNKTKYSNPHTVHIFAPTQEEMEAIVNSSMVHVADITDTGYNPVQKNLKYITSGALNLDTRDILTDTTTGSDIVSNAIKRHELRVVNEAANSSVFTGKQSMKNIENLLAFDREARKKGLGTGLDLMEQHGVSLTQVLKSNTGSVGRIDSVTGQLVNVEYFNDKQFKQLQKLYTQKMGYKDNIDIRTLTKTSAAYENVMSKKEYYTNLINITRGNFSDKKITKEMNDYFLELNKRVTAETLKDAGYSDAQIRRMVNNMTNYSTHEYAFFDDRFDFTIGRDFKIIGRHAEKIENPFSASEIEGNILTYNVADNNANAKFMNQLYKLRMGSEASNPLRKAEDVAAHKIEAVHQFLMDMHYNNKEAKILYSNKDFKNYMLGLVSDYEKTGKISETFDPNEAMTFMGQAIKQAKGKDMLAGVHNVVGNVNILKVNQELAGHLNAVSSDTISDISNGIKHIVKYDDKTRASKVSELVQVFGIDNATFEYGLEGLSPIEVKTKTLIRDITHEQLANNIDDILKTSAKYGIDVHVDELNKMMILEKDGKRQVLEKMPKVVMGKDGTIRLVSGGSDINIDLMLEEHATKKGKRVHVTTNLDSDFGKKDYFYNIIGNRAYTNNGEVDLTVFDKFIGYNIRESYENTRHSGLKTDLTTANKRIDLSAATNLIYDAVRPEGPLSYLLDDYEAIDPDMITKVRKHINQLKPLPGQDRIRPEQMMTLINDIPGLAKIFLDPESNYYDTIMDIMDHIGPTTKETALVKGKFQIGDRIMGTWTNRFDNPQRPPMTGAGNINYIDMDDIAKLKGLNVLPGSIIESNDTLKLIYRTDEALNLTSDFRAPQVYMSAPWIQAEMKSQKDIIMNADIDNLTVKQMTKKKLNNVYDKLIEDMTSGTYEQARIGDARIFDTLLNMPVDVQYLSPNKNIMDAINESKDQEQFERLMNLVGKIERDESGNLIYRRDRTGTIVRKGENIVNHLAYGDIKQSFGSKHDMGVLSFSISSNGRELTDKQITAILNENAEFFSELDEIDDQYKMLNKLLGILEKKELRATYKIANVNQASLLKVQDAGVEKGMTLIPRASLGELNETVASYFNNLGPGFKDGMIPTKEAIMALHEDIAAQQGITVDELVKQTSDKVKSEIKGFKGFSGMDDVFKLVKDEREVPAILGFGEYGAFKGFASVANDNILKHENMGLATFANFEEVVRKYSSVSGKSFNEAKSELVKAMQDNDDINFIRHTDNGLLYGSKGDKLTVDKFGTMITEGAPEGESSLIDNQKFENFMEYANDLIVTLDKNADENIKLVHENVWGYDKEGNLEKYDKKIGNFRFKKIEHEGEMIDVIVGATSYGNHSIIKDSETISGVSQQYIEAKKAINRMSIIDPSLLTDKQREELDALRGFVNSQKDSVSFVKADEQMLTLLHSERLNAEKEERLNSMLATPEGKNKIKFLAEKTGGDIKIDAETGKVVISDDIRNSSSYDGFIKQIEGWQVYNPMNEAELTEEMLKKPEYQHLRHVRDIAKQYTGADKVGIESAERIYKLQGMQLAADFNSSKIFKQDAIDNLVNEHGFEIMHINDYIPNEGSVSAGIESIKDKRLIIDLGENFSKDQRYIAIPAGGQQIGDMEALTGPQGKLNQVKRQMDRLNSLEGGSPFGGLTYQEWMDMPESRRQALKQQSLLPDGAIEKFENAAGKIQELREEIVQMTDSFPEKGGLFTKATKIEVPQAATRSKILSITSTSLTNEALGKMGLSEYEIDPNSENFLKKAKIMMADGTEKSLFELQQQGIHYDFERVGIHEFENAGMFTPEELAKHGFTTKEEMIEYLQTYGDADMSMRYPLIRSDSVYGTRKYLDRQFDYKNAKSVSSPSMLAYNGDSDGDSESAFQAKLNDVSFSLYEHQRKTAIGELRAEGQEITQDTVKERVVSKGLIDEETYEGFRKFSAGMDTRAILVNPKYADQVSEDILKDIANNRKVGELGGITYQLKDAESQTFKKYKLETLHEMPNAEALKLNNEKVQEAINHVLSSDPSVYKDDLLDKAHKVANGSLDISNIEGKQKYELLDMTMKALEENMSLSENTFATMQQALVDRVRYQQLFEEGGAKATKSVIGPVNKSLNSLKQVASRTYKNEGSEFYNPDLGNILFEAGYQIEQKTVISGKKVAFEVGDTRVTELEDIISAAANGRGGMERKQKLADWFDIYMPSDSTETIWNSLTPTTKAKEEGENGFIKSFITAERGKDIYKNVAPEELEKTLELRAKNRYIAEKMVDSISQVSNVPELAADISTLRSLGYMGSKSSNVNTTVVPSNNYLTTRMSNMMKDIDPTEANKVVENATKRSNMDMLDLTNFVDSLQNDTEKITEAAEKSTTELLTKTPKLSVGTLGVAALGVAAGLMVAGYAGGGHQRPTKPQDDSQPVEVAPMLDDGGVDNGMRQQGYIINIKADTDKGARHLKKTLKDVAKASSSNGDVTINMNYRTTSGGGYSNKDIENIINNFI